MSQYLLAALWNPLCCIMELSQSVSFNHKILHSGFHNTAQLEWKTVPEMLPEDAETTLKKIIVHGWFTRLIATFSGFIFYHWKVSLRIYNQWISMNIWGSVICCAATLTIIPPVLQRYSPSKMNGRAGIELGRNHAGDWEIKLKWEEQMLYEFVR